MSLSAHGATFVDAEVRSAENMPFIAHINLKLTDAEWKDPESVAVHLASSKPAEFISQLRSRIFFQSAGRLAFVRVSGLIPLPGPVELTLTSRHLSGIEKAVATFEGQTAVLSQIKPPLRQPETTAFADPAESAKVAPQKPVLKKSQISEDDSIAQDQIEVRLVDQTRSNLAAARSSENDLALLASEDRSLNPDPSLIAQAETSIGKISETLAGLGVLFSTQVTEQVATQALKKEAARNRDSFTVTLSVDDTGKLKAAAGSAAEQPAAPVEEIKPAAQTKAAAASKGLTQPPASANQVSLSQSVPAPAAGTPVAVPLEEGSGFGWLWPLLAGLDLTTAAGFVLWKRLDLQQQAEQAMAQLPDEAARSGSKPSAFESRFEAEKSVLYAGLDGQGGIARYDGVDENTEPEPAPLEPYPAQFEEPEPPPSEPTANSIIDADAQHSIRNLQERLAALEAELARKSAEQANRDAFDDASDAENQYPEKHERNLSESFFDSEQINDEADGPDAPLQPESLTDDFVPGDDPPFLQENDSRIELAQAYLEIGDHEAVEVILSSTEGELSPEQTEAIEQIRLEMAAKGADA